MTDKERLKELIKKQDEKMANFDYENCQSFAEFFEYIKEEQDEISKLSRKIRLSKKDYKLKDIPDYGDFMTLEEFAECCMYKGFIDSDGFGYYATKDKMTDITINPSDITTGEYKKDFPNVVWFNK